ncbi:MAG: sigma-70 family RNA polymerase sigma factor [Candidatus Eremiobacteraeota bacterium]|nr:sigma-70 family RNA polymerase sigma factor [Candidatus Eremiobacteraeota bacterium]
MSADEREATIRRCLPIVRQIARRVARLARISDLDDLIGDGCIGLIRAVDCYDPDRGTAFELYARRLIVGAMLNGLRRRDPVSERVRRTMRRAEEQRYAIAQERGSLPPFAELERDDPALRRARFAVFVQASLSLDAPMMPGRDPLVDWSQEPAARAIERDRARRLAQAIALLPERQQRILTMHYAGEQSLHAIGRVLRVSPQRVSQLHLLALASLRHTVARP